MWCADSQLVLQIFNEEQTLFWSGAAERERTSGRCCFWQKWWQDQAEQLVRVHSLWGKKKVSPNCKTHNFVCELQSTALIANSYVSQITECGIIAAENLKNFLLQ